MGGRNGATGGSFRSPGEVREQFGVSPSRVGEWLAICGDACDRVPGVQRFGARAATALLGGLSDEDTRMFSKILQEFLHLDHKGESRRKGTTEEEVFVALKKMGLPRRAAFLASQNPAGIYKDAMFSFHLVRLPPVAKESAIAVREVGRYPLRSKCERTWRERGQWAIEFEGFRREFELDLTSDRGWVTDFLFTRAQKRHADLLLGKEEEVCTTSESISPPISLDLLDSPEAHHLAVNSDYCGQHWSQGQVHSLAWLHLHGGTLESITGEGEDETDEPLSVFTREKYDEWFNGIRQLERIEHPAGGPLTPASADNAASNPETTSTKPTTVPSPEEAEIAPATAVKS